MVDELPEDHPRAESLHIRHKIIEGMHKLVVAEAGLIAHGRGEAWDYLIGEHTNPNAINTMKVAVAQMLLAKSPVISVNGNVAILCPNELVEFSKLTNAPLEINLFYGKKGRIEAITETLRKAGAEKILGTVDRKKEKIPELSSNRRHVDPEGIKIADVVMVPLEDGDRTEALIKQGKKVIAIDLNPLNRTSQWADITIVDNIIRALPIMIEICKEFQQKNTERGKLTDIVEQFDNKRNLSNSIEVVINYLGKLSKKGKYLEMKKN
ncbi:MAG: phosphopantothenate/pantothenate synthetase [Candidatus Lokiarchaeota archaeon]|nr:phosphopantothenate/pantothenate synthetase [Candidatus Lokiarchaeota archaeon]